MSNKSKKQDGELSEQQLDRISGGQEIRKVDTVYVTAVRPKQQAQLEVRKMDTVVVTAKREKPDAAGTRLAAVDSKSKKN